jgi:hypothetical protein
VNKFKTARTTKDYEVEAFGYQFTIPANSLVSNQTAQGNNDQYRFWIDYHHLAAKITGSHDSILAHDLKHRGINIPAEFCEPYPD